MIYLSCKDDCSFFGEVFLKNELITKREFNLWIEKQNNIYAMGFVNKYFTPINVKKNKIYFSFGRRFEL